MVLQKSTEVPGQENWDSFFSEDFGFSCAYLSTDTSTHTSLIVLRIYVHCLPAFLYRTKCTKSLYGLTSKLQGLRFASFV